MLDDLFTACSLSSAEFQMLTGLTLLQRISVGFYDRKGYDSLLYWTPSLLGHLEVSQSARKTHLVSICWKTSQGTQYTECYPRELLAWVIPECKPNSITEVT